MQIYVGTYQGNVQILQSDTTEITPFRQLLLSENSLKAMTTIGNDYLIVGGFDQEVRVIDLKRYQEKVQAKQNVGQITTIKCISNKHFIVGVADGTIRLWNTNTFTIDKEARFHKKPISSMILTKDSKILLTAAGNKIILWNPSTLKKAHEYKLDKDIVIQHMQITDDMQYIYYCTDKGEIWRIVTETNDRKMILKFPTARKIQVFHLYEGFIVLGNDIGDIMAFKDQANENGELQSLNFQHRIEFKAHNSRIKSLKIIQGYLIVATANGDISIWDFPLFLQQVQNINQIYMLQGLEPLTKTQVKGRVLCLQAIIKEEGQGHKEEVVEEKIQVKEEEEGVKVEEQNVKLTKKLLKKKKKLEQLRKQKLQDSKNNSSGQNENGKKVKNGDSKIHKKTKKIQK